MSQARVVRFFVKPSGQQWLDLPLGPNQTMQQVFTLMKTEGYVVHDLFILPMDSVLYAGMLTFEIADGKPSLTVVPGPWPTPNLPTDTPPAS